MALARRVLCIALAAFNFNGAALPAANADDVLPRPNMLLILADDLGFSDLGCYGSEIATPNLDRLASSGLRFTQFYNAARCCPTRAAIMTGHFPHRVGITGWTGLLNQRCATVFELLKQAGYHTGAVGRLDMTTADVWHALRIWDGWFHDWPCWQRMLDLYLGGHD